ncbi:hypothetical protein ACFORL_03745 [Legionella dresdenensis]|uniref:Uncharacterized protein n=1 Tax=Legionella dresdenensis TaxID=450200 RepID=A0ABV8CDB0_9GAMM
MSTATINNAEADMLFNSSNCTRPGSNNLCIAAGYNANIDAPLLVQSTDNGQATMVKHGGLRRSAGILPARLAAPIAQTMAAMRYVLRPVLIL